MKKALSLVLSAVMLLSVFSCVGVVKAEAAEVLSFFLLEVPDEKFSFCEYTNGFWSYEYSEETGEYKKIFIYDNFDLWQDGNTLSVSYTIDETDVSDKTYICVDGEFVDEKGNVFDDSWELSYTTDQEETPWTVGTYSITVAYDGLECSIPVEITESPVETVEFVPAEPIVLWQNVDGFGFTDDNGEESFYYDYETPFYAEGNKLNVTFKDGSSGVYTANGYAYSDENGSAVSFYDLHSYDVHDEALWTELGNYSAEFYFMGCKFSVPVTVVENPVESISFNTEKALVYYENTNGMWDYNYADEDSEEFFVYNDPLGIEGTSITLNYTDGTSSVYSYDAEKYDYINENGESLPTGSLDFESDQYDAPWGLGEHIFTFNAFDKTCEVAVTIIDNPVTEFEFETAEPIVFKYAEGGEWFATVDDYGEETEIYIYDSSVYSPYAEGNKIKVVLEDGSTVTYTYSGEKGAFVDENGEAMPYDAEILYVDVQLLVPWDETSPYNYLAVEFMGSYNVVPVVIENGLTVAPEIFDVYNDIGKIGVEWEPVAGAVEYRVYRKVGSSKSWEYLDTVRDCYYEDTDGIKDGQKYKYTVRGVNPSGKYGAYDKAGVAVEYIAPVQGVKIENLDGKIKISWDDYDGVECSVFRYSEGDDDWTFITSAPGAGYYVLDSEVESGEEYTYAVLASRNGCYSGYDTSVIKYLATPKLKSATNATSGITVKWGAVKGADSYRVYRKGSTGGWKLIDVTENTSCTDKSVVNKSGSTYKYTVRAVSGKTLSSYNKTGLSIKRLGTVELSSIANSASGVTLKWNAVKGADGYRVYRRVGDGGWSYIGNTSKASYTDKEVKSNSGVTYNYTVRATYGKTYGDYNRDGWDIVRLTAPSLKSTENYPTGAKVTWGKVKGAKGYYVYRKTNSTGWKRLALVNGNATTSYIDKTAESGILYTYTVRAVNGTSTSSYVSKGISLKYLATPKITAKVTSSGVNLKWNKPTGTKDFRVYRIAEGETKWTTLKDTTSLSYTDKTAKNGVKYTYAVRARNGSVISSVNKATLEFISTPKVKSVANKASGIELKWSKVADVEGYRIYRKTGNGSWKNLGDVDASVLSFVDETAVAGETYTYTVRAFSGKYFSAYIASAQIVRVSQPEVVLDIQENNVAIGWSPVEGADKYYVYRKLDGGWERLAIIKSEDAVTDENGIIVYIDEDVDISADYYYTVKAYNGSYASSYVADCSLSDVQSNVIM